MKQPLRLLLVEDSEDDATLIVRHLQQSGYAVDLCRVETEEQMGAALRQHAWDLVIADYRLPLFSAPEALSLHQKFGLDIPFLLVSGTVGEDTAVSIMKAGARDFVLKDHLERLPPAVKRELHEAGIRQQNREAEQKLRAAHAELEAIYANAPVLMFVANDRLRVEKINDLAANFCGVGRCDSRRRSICELLHCTHPVPVSVADQPGEACCGCPLSLAFADAFHHGIGHRSVEVWTPLSGDGEPHASCLLVSVAPMINGRARRALVTAQDVTHLKDTEKSLQESIDSLKAALAENVVLFQEVHHRVKNNLQIIASLLSIKARKDRHLIGAEDLKDCERRVKSMAMIHEQLYSRRDMSQVDFAEHVRKIVPELIDSFDRADSICLRLELHPVVLSIDESIPCALILNELVTNAAKYAYPEGRGEVFIGLGCRDGAIRLTVADHGVGMPADGKGGSLGMQIIHMLAKKLRGSVEFAGPPGTSASLSFPG